MTDIAPEAAVAMDAWARWTRGEESRGGASSPAWLMMQAKKVGICPRGTAPLPDMAANVLCFDQSVAALKQQNWRLAKVLMVDLLQYAPAEEKAARCGLRGKIRTYYRLVRRAVLAVANTFLQKWRDLVGKPVTKTDTYAAHCGYVPPGTLRAAPPVSPN